GIVGDVRHLKMEVPPRPEAYLPYPKIPARSMHLVVRTSVEPVALASDVRTMIRSADQDILILNVVTMEGVVSSTLAKPRLFARFLSSFALVACALAVTGIYGVTAFIVSAKMREYGIRIALGAQRQSLLRMIILQGFRLIGLGALLGLAGAYLLTSYLASLLYEVSPLDPLTFAGMSVALVAVALLAIYLPARRATRADPVEILRVN
ncbi:MAG: FtsX-like permease family protein, partial [bacterium]|nr:FtsX-like permease family protein [bacterium]